MKSLRKAVMEIPENAHNDQGEDILLLKDFAHPHVRPIGAVNWVGLWTLTAKEIRRFWKIAGQTVLSPLVMTLLFYAVFALGTQQTHRVAGLTFMQFAIPGLIMMAMAPSAFMNTAVSLIISKVQGNIVDVLMPPLSPMELTLAYTLSGLVRGLLVGVVTTAVLWGLTPISIHNLFFVVYFAVMGAIMLSLIGVITGVWGDKFDHMGTVQNFLIMPATFLSGSFFSVTSLPEQWRFVCFVNPFFYMIDGFRYGFTGVAEGPLTGGMAILMIVNLALLNISYWMFAHSPRLRN